MHLLSMISSVASASQSAGDGSKIIFDPANFLYNLKYMGIGMLVIFVIIGIIILTTMLINKAFSD